MIFYFMCNDVFLFIYVFINLVIHKLKIKFLLSLKEEFLFLNYKKKGLLLTTYLTINLSIKDKNQ